MHRYCFQAHAGHLNADLWSVYHRVGCITLEGENRGQAAASALNLAPIFFFLAAQTCLKTRPVQTTSPSKTVHYYQSTLSWTHSIKKGIARQPADLGKVVSELEMRPIRQPIRCSYLLLDASYKR